MRERILGIGGVGLIGAVAALLAACGGGGGGGNGPGGTAGVVAGLVVVHDDVATRDPAAVGAPPVEWSGSDAVDGKASLAHADWTLAGSGRRGTTAGDGSFAIDGLTPGRHTLDLTRTLGGDLVSTTLSFGVGDDGSSSVLGELAWGTSRATSTYVRNGRTLQEIFVPSNVHVVVEDGRIVELGDGIRVWEDQDRDGDFDTCIVIRDAATCVVAQIGAILTQIPESMRVGQRSGARATLTLDDGSALDVTAVARWQSSNPAVASVDSFGRLTAHAAGSTEIQAQLGALGSLLTTLEVRQRASLTRVHVQNASCYYPFGIEDRDAPEVDPDLPADQGIWAPSCTQIIEVGGTLYFIALGEFADGEVQDVTGEVAWTFDPASVADVANGVVTGRAVGDGQLAASLSGVASEPTDVRVVAEPTLVGISIYPQDGGVGLPVAGVDGGVGLPVAGVDDEPLASAANDVPCVGCSGFALTMLLGDDVPLHATGHCDTGAWRDITLDVTWSSSAPSVATVGPEGRLVTRAVGDTVVTASLGGIQSEAGQIRVVEDATLQHLWIHQPGEGVLGRGDQRFFTATGHYDLGFSRDVTREVEWHTSDAAIARIDAEGILTGVDAGDVEVWAEADGVVSDRVRLEVFATSELDYCDPAEVNRGTWTDGFNRVVLESDCATYAHPDVAALRFTVTETTSPGGIFDPCLDLYVFQGSTPVRTIREERCGDPFLPDGSAGLDEEILKYQLRAFWDLKDDDGIPVPPGDYQIHGRFYLYYDPVVSLTVTIE